MRAKEDTPPEIYILTAHKQTRGTDEPESLNISSYLTDAVAGM